MIERRIPDAQAALLRALERRSAAFELVEASSERWASVTFTGARHRLLLRFAGADATAEAGRFCAGLDAAEFALVGHIVADIAVASMVADRAGATVELEALTAEDR